jgi:hypothetical protein
MQRAFKGILQAQSWEGNWVPSGTLEKLALDGLPADIFVDPAATLLLVALTAKRASGKSKFFQAASFEGGGWARPTPKEQTVSPAQDCGGVPLQQALVETQPETPSAKARADGQKPGTAESPVEVNVREDWAEAASQGPASSDSGWRRGWAQRKPTPWQGSNKVYNSGKGPKTV